MIMYVSCNNWLTMYLIQLSPATPHLFQSFWSLRLRSSPGIYFIAFKWVGRMSLLYHITVYFILSTMLLDVNINLFYLSYASGWLDWTRLATYSYENQSALRRLINSSTGNTIGKLVAIFIWGLYVVLELYYNINKPQYSPLYKVTGMRASTFLHHLVRFSRQVVSTI